MGGKNAISCTSSLEAKHLIWVWIIKVKGHKNQADFIEVLYVVVKVVRYSIGQKMSNFTFYARSQQWLVQLPQKFM